MFPNTNLVNNKSNKLLFLFLLKHILVVVNNGVVLGTLHFSGFEGFHVFFWTTGLVPLE